MASLAWFLWAMIPTPRTLCNQAPRQVLAAKSACWNRSAVCVLSFMSFLFVKCHPVLGVCRMLELSGRSGHHSLAGQVPEGALRAGRPEVGSAALGQQVACEAHGWGRRAASWGGAWPRGSSLPGAQEAAWKVLEPGSGVLGTVLMGGSLFSFVGFCTHTLGIYTH